MLCGLCTHEMGEARRILLECPYDSTARKETLHAACFVTAYKSCSGDLIAIMDTIEKNRARGYLEPSIGQSCTKCRESIKESELWSHRVARRGVPGETARVAERSLYTHEPNCPEK